MEAARDKEDHHRIPPFQHHCPIWVSVASLLRSPVPLTWRKLFSGPLLQICCFATMPLVTCNNCPCFQTRFQSTWRSLSFTFCNALKKHRRMKKSHVFKSNSVLNNIDPNSVHDKQSNQLVGGHSTSFWNTALLEYPLLTASLNDL